MRIDGTGSDSTRPAGSRGVEKTSKEELHAKKSEAIKPAASDRVEISDAGRAAAAQLSEPGAVDAEKLSVERVEEIRGRIATGLYDTPEIQEEVVRRMLDAGDLGALEGPEEG